jgi:hypothetical protein
MATHRIVPRSIMVDLYLHFPVHRHGNLTFKTKLKTCSCDELCVSSSYKRSSDIVSAVALVSDTS